MSATLLLLAALLQQGRAPEVMLAVDHDRVVPGEVVTFTIRVTSRSTEPIRVEPASLGGFELESRAERSEVSPGPSGGRTTTIELHLRANTPGDWRLGPVTVRQGAHYAQSSAVNVVIEGGTPGQVTAGLSPRLANLVQRATPPRSLRQAGVTVAISDGDAVLGQQVDVVTIAWFEREVRQQLRRAPTVEAPRLDGVWSYPQPVPGGIAASRQVNGRWYDLFVLHQVAFPLTPGRVSVSAARLQYSVPLAFQFFSQEERYTLESEPSGFRVRPLPTAGRQPDFAGAVGHELSLSQSVTPGSGRQGEAFTADVVVRGEGNVALWPQPDARWPNGVRVYPESAEEQVSMKNGLLTGAKVFRFLLLADSAGTISLPGLRYSYFDPGLNRYLDAATPGVVLVVAPRGDAPGSRAEPPPIRLDGTRPLALRVQSVVPSAAWWGLLVLPVLIHLIPVRRQRRRAVVPVVRIADPLAAAEKRLDQALRSLIPSAEARGDGALALVLRQAGVEPAAAEELVRLRDRLRAARFAPGGSAPGHQLLAEVEAAAGQVAPTVGRNDSRWRRRAGLATVAVCLVGPGSSSLRAQASPEQLYEAGAYQAAADGFRRRALQASDVPANWLNLGDAAYRAGDDAGALAAWTRGARLAPRDGGLRRALLLVSPADASAARWLWIAPVAPAELWLLGLVAWVAGWAGVLWRRRWQGRWVVLLAGGVVCFTAGLVLASWYRRPVAVVASNTVLRLSPHELAPAVGEVPELGAVRLESERGAWLRVEAPGGRHGWIRREEVTPLSRS